MLGEGAAQGGGEDAVGRAAQNGLAFEEEDGEAAEVDRPSAVSGRIGKQMAGSVRSGDRIPALVFAEKVAIFSCRPQGASPAGLKAEAPAR